MPEEGKGWAANALSAMWKPSTLLCLLLFVFGGYGQVESLKPAAPEPIKCARYPALAPDGKTLCFSYLGDLWTVSADGGRAGRITAHPAHDRRPVYSPNGGWIAFESNRTGDYNIFVIPASGGPARQITYHSGTESLLGWQDDKTLLMYARRDTRMPQIYAIDIATVRTHRLTSDTDALRCAAPYPEPGRLLLVRGPQFWARTNYHGAAEGDIYLMSADGKGAERLTDDDGFDYWPMTGGDGKVIYWVSARGAKTEASETNLWQMNADGSGGKQVTHFETDYVSWPSLSADGRRVAFEHDADMYVMDLPSGEPRKLSIIAPSDDIYEGTVAKTYTDGATELAVTQDGGRVAFVVVGDIFWVDAKRGGEAKRLTDSPANDRNIAWSPDGKQIAFVSNRKVSPDDYGTYNLYVVDVETGLTTQMTKNLQPEYNPVYSPDGKWIAYRRGVWGKYLVVVPSEGGTERIVADQIFLEDLAWSPDGKWLAYTAEDIQANRNVYLVPFDPNASGMPEAHNVTMYYGSHNRVQFGADGKYLFFESSRGGEQVFALPLRPEPDKDDMPIDEEGNDEEKPRVEPVIEPDFYLIEERARQLTSLPGGVGHYAVTPDGKTVIFQSSDGVSSDLWSVPVRGGDQKRISSGNEQPGAMVFPVDGKKLWFLGPGGSIRSIGKEGGASTPLSWSAYHVFDRREQLLEMFDEAWATLGREFYDPNMHGTDWLAMRAKYRPLTEHVAMKEDFYNTWHRLLGEFGASHTAIFATDQKIRPTASLGVRFDEGYDGRGVKVVEVIKRGPAEHPDSRLYPGDIILSIDGQEVESNDKVWEPLADKAGRRVTLRVRGAEGEREVKIRPTGDLDQILYEEWVDRNAEKVAEWSDGKIAYLHVQGMEQISFDKMQRWLFGPWCQGKDGLIVDVRYNGGGWLHDDIYALFARRQHAWEQGRDGPRRTMPRQVWGKPVLMMINQFSGSDAEIAPSGFKYLGFGKVLGMPTYGGVIGTYQIRLVDGTTGFLLPVSGWWTMDGQNLEGYCVPPDIYVDNSFEDSAGGYDRQLHEAVKTLMK
jgi:tricorn protease